MSHGRVVSSAIAVVVVALIGVGFWHAREDGATPAPTSPFGTGARTIPRSLVSTGLVSSSFAGLTLRHPASWRFIASDEGRHESGPGQTVGYLTDQVVVTPECSLSGAVTSCEAAVRHLQPGGIVVTVSQSQLNAPIRANTTVGGQPAVVIRSAAADCSYATTARTYEVDARIQTSPRTTGNSFVAGVEIDACAAYPVSAQTRQSITRMLDTARF